MISSNYKKLIVVTIFTLFVLLYLSSFDSDYKNSYTMPYVKDDLIYDPRKRKPKYLINTTNCHIPDIDLHNEESKTVFHKEEYTKCTDLDLLTYIEKNNGTVSLNVNSSLLPQYSSYNIKCCYSKIIRVSNTDDKVTFSPCEYFKEKIAIHHPFVKVTCFNSFLLKVYENVHAAVLPKLQQSLSNTKQNTFSVLMVGIDSMSKQNLRRTMPKSYNFLEEHYINLKGYNKIGENTLPNLLATLTGNSMSQMSCVNKDSYAKCNFIWNTYKSLGYTTAFGEDETYLATFNWLKPGFIVPPTDYYYRPYFLAAEQLSSVKSKCHSSFCAGPESSGERIMNAAKDFSITFHEIPTFGLFWTNSFSHDNINCPSAMDNKVLEFLSDKEFISTLNNTIFIFLSDHGFRFGDFRYTNAGLLEDKLPFIYIHIPDRFKLLYPGEYKNILINSERLTTPYDLHNTLQHILAMAHKQYITKKSLGCSKCRSVFHEIDEMRTCEDVGISQRWCSCRSFYHSNTTSKAVTKVAHFVIQKINNLIADFSESHLCSNYSLDYVHSAGVSDETSNGENGSNLYYLVIVKTKPDAMFEATVNISLQTKILKLVGDISRLSKYADTSHCTENPTLKKYCYCNDFMSIVKTKLCNLINMC